MAVTKAWKVYGRDGHRQRESFHKSVEFFEAEAWKDNLGRETEIVTVEVENFDKTGTHEYSIIRITGSTPEICDRELNAQLSDGVFENSRTGWIEQIEGPYFYFDTDFRWSGYPTDYDWALIKGSYVDGEKNRRTEEPVVFGNYSHPGQDLWAEWDDIDAAIEAELGFCPDYEVN